MSIKWRCDCGKSLKVPDGSEGRKAKCPQCGAVNIVPAPAALEEENEGLELLDDGPPPIPDLPPPPPIPAAPAARRPATTAKASATAAAPAAPSPDKVSDDDDWGHYDLKEEEPPPVPTRRPVATVPAAAAGAARQSVGSSASGAITPPPYRPAAQTDDEDDDDLPLAERQGRTWRDFTYLALLLAMLPLVVFSFRKDESIGDLIDRTVAAHPEFVEKLKEFEAAGDVDDDTFIDAFPGHRLQGALLERRTSMHWVFAGISAALYLTLLLFLFDGMRDAKPLGLVLCGLFTGTVGILLLLLFQFIANIALGMRMRRVRGGKLIVFILIIKFIGFSYYAADHPEYGFLASFLGYTFGVGLCEEICKLLPILWLLRNHPERATWRGLCKWGLASGIGFGVAEGIMYSSRYYNGIYGGDVYLVRFASCVALHAVWSASFALAMYLAMDSMAKESTASGTLGYAVLAAALPMTLHGLYDTLLKKDHNLWALAVALFSFVYLAALIEWSLRKADRANAPPSRGFEVAPRGYAVG